MTTSANYFVYIGFVCAFIFLFILATRLATLRNARNKKRLYDASQRLPTTQPQTTQVWTPQGYRPANEVYGDLTNGQVARTGGTVGVNRVVGVDGQVEGEEGGLPSYGAPSIPVPESIYSPSTARYTPPSFPPHTSATENTMTASVPTIASTPAPPEYKIDEEAAARAEGRLGHGVTPPKYDPTNMA